MPRMHLRRALSRASVLAAAFVLICNPLIAENLLDFSAQGGIFVPLQSGVIVATNGESGSFVTDLKTESLPIIGRAELGYKLVPINNTSATMSLASLGAYGGIALDPWQRFRVSCLVGAGAYWGAFNSTQFDSAGEALATQSGGGILAGASLGGEFFITPSSSIRAETAYAWYVGLFQNLQFSIGYVLHIDGLGAKAGIQNLKIDRYFPSLMNRYGKAPIVTFRLVNKERFSISDVKVALLLPGLGTGTRIVNLDHGLGPGEIVDLSLLAPETSAIIQGEAARVALASVRIEYRAAGVLRRVDRREPVQIMSKNAIVWDDDAKAASFVTPTAPEVLACAKSAVPIIHSLDYPTANRSVLTAAGLFSCLGSLGLVYCVNPNLPSYEDASRNVNIVDSIQFPGETLSFRSGNCSDLSVLYASTLEALGVETAFVTVPGHIFVAFALGANERDIDRLPANKRHILVHDGRCWMPVETTLVGRPFAEAVDSAAKSWSAAALMKTAGFFSVHEAWANYPPAVFSLADEGKYISLDQKAAAEAASRSMAAFTTGELLEQETSIKRELASTSDMPSALNKLGLLYVRYGLLEKAKETFLSIARTAKYYPALLNLGNIATVRRDYETALGYYESADEVRPDSTICAYNIAKTLIALSRIDEAQKFIELVRRSDSILADKLVPTATAVEGTRSADESQSFADLSWWKE